MKLIAILIQFSTVIFADEGSPVVVPKYFKEETAFIEAAKKACEKQPPWVLFPEGSFGTIDKPSTKKEMEEICQKLKTPCPKTAVTVGAYLNPPTRPMNAAITCFDGKIFHEEHKGSYGVGEEGKITLGTSVRPSTFRLPNGKKAAVVICSDLYNMKKETPMGADYVGVIADYSDPDFLQVANRYAIAVRQERGSTPTMVLCNGNENIRGSGIIPPERSRVPEKKGH